MILVFGIGLVAATVLVHAAGLSFLIWWLPTRAAAVSGGFWSRTVFFINVICGLVILHILEISIWALFYLWHNCLPDVETAFYFSGVTYATVGYGDVVLPDRYRMLGPIQGLTGILMCSWSAALFFAFFTRLLATSATRNS